MHTRTPPPIVNCMIKRLYKMVPMTVHRHIRMGQYYLAILLAEKELTKEEIIRGWLCSVSFGALGKLMEHSYINNSFVTALENLISPDGMFHKSRVVWAGDCADNEPDSEQNLMMMADADQSKKLLPAGPPRDFYCDFMVNTEALLGSKTECIYRYVVNHTKKQYVDKKHRDMDGAVGLTLPTAESGGGDLDGDDDIHPLPLLTAEGNGRGGGDYYGSDMELVGTWARDVISVERRVPEGYSELVCNFTEHIN